MTVQSIDQRPTTDSPMTTATPPQGAASVEAAFAALLQQTVDRFSNTLVDTLSVGTLLSQALAPAPTPADPSAGPVAPQNANTTSSAPPAAAAAPLPPRGAKPIFPRQAHGGAAPAPKTSDQSAAPADTATAPADTPAAPTATTPTTTTVATGAAKDDKPAADTAPLSPDPNQIVAPVITAPVAQDQVTVPIAAVDPSAAPVAAATAPAAAVPAATDPLAGLGKGDRQRIADLQQKIMGDLASGDTGDALDSANQLVSTLIAKATAMLASGNAQPAGSSQSGTAQPTDTSQPGAASSGNTDSVQAQAQGLANMLAGSGAKLDIKVQTNQPDQTDPTTQTAAAPVDAVAQPVVAVQGQPAANPGFDQAPQRNPQANAGAQAVDPLAQATAAQAAPAADPAQAFSSVLAAQIGADAPTAAQPTQPQTPVALAAVGATQAPTTQTASAQAAAPTARAPRVPLQQQVMDQVKVQIDKAVAGGVDTVKIQLKPLDLGKIEIKLDVVDGHVSATVTADRPETLALLQKNSDGLDKALQDAGLKPDPNSTSFNLRGGDQQQNADRGNTNNQRSGNGSGGGGQGFDPEIAAITATQAAQSTGLGASSGVDLSV